jgi:hypothetical protein
MASELPLLNPMKYMRAQSFRQRPYSRRCETCHLRYDKGPATLSIFLHVSRTRRTGDLTATDYSLVSDVCLHSYAAVTERKSRDSHVVTPRDHDCMHVQLYGSTSPRMTAVLRGQLRIPTPLLAVVRMATAAGSPVNKLPSLRYAVRNWHLSLAIEGLLRCQCPLESLCEPLPGR